MSIGLVGIYHWLFIVAWLKGNMNMNYHYREKSMGLTRDGNLAKTR